MYWSRLRGRQISSQNILIHEITVIVKVHFTVFIAVDRRRTRNTWSCFGTNYHISYPISYTISGTILRTLQSDCLWLFDIGIDIEEKPSISGTIFKFRALWLYDIGTISKFLHRYRIRYRIAISGYKEIEGQNFDVVQDIGIISGYKEIEGFASISKVLSISGTICHTWGGWAHRPRSSPADGSRLLVLHPLGRSVLLRDCLDALPCCPTHSTPRNVQCSCPSGAEKCSLDPVGVLIAIAAHKLSETL